MYRAVKQLSAYLCMLSFISSVVMAQTPTGTISGTVKDQNGAVVSKAAVTVKNKSTNFERKLKTADDGTYFASLLSAGEYEVTTEVSGFRTNVTGVIVQVGAVVPGNINLEVGHSYDTVNVEASNVSALNFESHNLDGVITRQNIQGLPLNGRSFMNLANLQPGVTVTTGSTAQYNSLFQVSVLGGETKFTALTIDGGTVRDPINGHTSVNMSQEVVQEFQLSSNNFDLSTGITGVGSINVVTRTGGNDLHGSGYFFFRDRNAAAYPALLRNSVEPNPFFARRNPGFWIGGPIAKNRLFFFTNYEYTNQMQVVTILPDLPSVRGLATNYGSPYKGHLFTQRFDLKINDNHNLFFRYSADRNKAFGPSTSNAFTPSDWVRNTNHADQAVLGLSSVFKSTLVNDFRINFTYWSNRNFTADDTNCAGCIGLGFMQLHLAGSNNFRVGNVYNAPQRRDVRYVTFNDNLTWQKGSHRFKFGTDLTRAMGSGSWEYCLPGCAAIAAPELVRGSLPAFIIPIFFPTLPTTIRTNEDLLNLPFYAPSQLGGVGIGNPLQPPPYKFSDARKNDRIRFYGQDSWKLSTSFTFNYGLAWNYEGNLFNKDLTKPRLLAPIYGSDLSATKGNNTNFSPALGFAWNVGGDNKTVIRGGAGIYWETAMLVNRLQERAFIGPQGNGRVLVPFSNFRNIYPGIFKFTAAGPAPVAVGAPLSLDTLTNLTLRQFMGIYNMQIGALQAALAPRDLNDLSIRSIDVFKAGQQLYPREHPTPRSYQINFGVQRELRSDLIVSADFVRRVNVNTNIGQVDYNRFERRLGYDQTTRLAGGIQSPVIPQCTSTQALDPAAQCSNGPITFWTPAGRSVYTAMLLKVDKRFSKRFQLSSAYALASQHGINLLSQIDDRIPDMDDYTSSYGPQGPRHVLNVSALVDLPAGFQFGFMSSLIARSPQMPVVVDVDLDGDGTTIEPVPGFNYNCFGRGCGKTELETAINNWNANLAGKVDARGRRIPQLVLPSDYDFGDSVITQDVRLTKKFTFKENISFSVFTEIFNIFNIANLSGYSMNLDRVNPSNPNAARSFGQPTQRFVQTFGSGGPRAVQFGARLNF